MSTTPITTWQQQLRSLLYRYEKFETRDDAYRALIQMANVAELYVAEHPATDSRHTPVKEQLRSSLQGHLGGDKGAYGKLLHIAGLADQHEAIVKIAPTTQSSETRN
jgi:hypothetical protein